MLLKKSMSENKKLNLDRPILSVRRYSSMKLDRTKFNNSLPITDTDILPSFPVKIAGAIPFQWEKAPGRPKENEDHNSRSSQEIQRGDSKGHDMVYCDDKAFADALKTLSTIESFLLNSCKGKNGPQTRELMVGGFLPKPMHTTEKQSLSSPQQQHQQLRLKMRVVCRHNYGHSMGKWCKERNASNVNDASWQRCGLRPWSCMNASVRLMNPAKNECELKPNYNLQTSENKSKQEKDEKAARGVHEETRRTGSNRITFEQLLADTWDKSNNTRSFIVNLNMQEAEKEPTKNVEKQLSRRSMTVGVSGRKCCEFINAPPPLLRSPSDSWLSRTLPSMSAKNFLRHSYIGGSNRSLNRMAPIVSIESETTV